MMEPVWSFTAQKQLWQWYDHVYLLEDRIVGQWYALRRYSGESLWEVDIPRANTIFAIIDGVILAHEMGNAGVGSGTWGCYGISLSDGKPLWSWYGEGIRGKIAKFLDRAPLFTNEIRPYFFGVRGNEVATDRGDILDTNTGRMLRHEAEISILKMNSDPQGSSWKIYYKGEAVEIDHGLVLSTREPMFKKEELPSGIAATSLVKPTKPFGFVLRNAEGHAVWDWSPTELGLHPLTDFFGWRLAGKKLLVLCREQTKKESKASIFRILSVDALSGTVDQDIAVSKEKFESGRIEYVDDKGMLVSCDNRDLQYYALGN